jgi:hypothetical protein
MAEDKTPEWVQGMHAFRQANGFFRTADVYRVLGNQEKSVQVPVITDLAAASLKPNS